MARVVIDVMLKPEIHDPQGDAIAESAPAPRLRGVPACGRASGSRSRSAARPTSAALDQAAKLAAELLANPVIEEFSAAPRLTARSYNGPVQHWDFTVMTRVTWNLAEGSR